MRSGVICIITQWAKRDRKDRPAAWARGVVLLQCRAREREERRTALHYSTAYSQYSYSVAWCLISRLLAWPCRSGLIQLMPDTHPRDNRRLSLSRRGTSHGVGLFDASRSPPRAGVF